MSIPLFLPHQFEKENTTVLAGDVGGTKTNLGVFAVENNKMKMLCEASYPSNAFNSTAEIIQHFLQETQQAMPPKICLGVAGPVINDEVEFTNIKWKINAKELQRQTNTQEVFLLNDLHANAYGLAGLDENDFVTISNGNKSLKGNMAIIAPGTGLGEAGLFWDGTRYHPFPTEGGHCDFAPKSETDIALYRFLRNKFEHVSWELVASGQAIHNLYLFLRDVTKMDEPLWLSEKLSVPDVDPLAVIGDSAMEETSNICIETMHLFARYVARASCNLALKMKSVGGLFISGGIPPKNLKYFQSALFYQTFIQCDRMQELVESIPVKIIMNSKTPLIGAAYYGAYGEAKNN